MYAKKDLLELMESVKKLKLVDLIKIMKKYGINVFAKPVILELEINVCLSQHVVLMNK